MHTNAPQPGMFIQFLPARADLTDALIRMLCRRWRLFLRAGWLFLRAGRRLLHVTIDHVRTWQRVFRCRNIGLLFERRVILEFRSQTHPRGYPGPGWITPGGTLTKFKTLVTFSMLVKDSEWSCSLRITVVSLMSSRSMYTMFGGCSTIFSEKSVCVRSSTIFHVLVLASKIYGCENIDKNIQLIVFKINEITMPLISCKHCNLYVWRWACVL